MGFLLTVAPILLLSASIWYAAKQLRANHDWNRRKAAQDATMLLIQQAPDTRLLDDALHHTVVRDPIPLEVVNKAVEDNAEVRRALHRYLNHYENLARGVRQGVYDEKIIMTACRGIMSRNWVRFGHYIAHRRSAGSPSAWSELELLLNKWQGEERQESMRLPTA